MLRGETGWYCRLTGLSTEPAATATDTSPSGDISCIGSPGTTNALTTGGVAEVSAGGLPTGGPDNSSEAKRTTTPAKPAAKSIPAKTKADRLLLRRCPLM